MKRLINFLFLATIAGIISCNCEKQDKNETAKPDAFIGEHYIKQTIDAVAEKAGEASKNRIEKGVRQVAGLWTQADGNEDAFKEFCVDNFVADEKELDVLLAKLSRNYEILNGYFNKMSVELKKPLHMDMGETGQIDEIFGSYEPASHINEDFFNNKIAFLVSLNFPYYTLQEKKEAGDKWTSKEWAYARMGDLYTTRIPADILLEVGAKTAEADNYIANYNIYMGNLVTNDNRTLFPSDMKLISHWNLRDELKSNYNNKENGLEKQKMIYDVMKHIIAQDIPANVVNSSEYTWNPVENRLFKSGNEVHFDPEPNTRYQHLLNIFKALKAEDNYTPFQPTYISRKFDGEMEISQEEVEKLFDSYLSSPVIKDVAGLIKNRLGRNLEPFDIWYDGFKDRSSISEEELDKITKKMYPNVEAFQNDLPNILVKLGFDKEKANFVSSKVTVDAARGAGHAWGSEMCSDNARLRTRIGADGMNYKGYNIAVHEFGHNVEQTISLQDVDYYMLRGVPNTAFTEALAFVFQERDLDLLGMKSTDENKKHLNALDNFWSVYEIMGVSMVDMNVWKWLYAHPDATAEELKKAVNDIAIEIWNKYYADVFGVKDQPILAIYSHMIDSPLYLSAYPIGLIIQFQLDNYFVNSNFAAEVERIYKNGRLIPQVWMKKAVGKEISPNSLIDAASEALKHVQ